MKKNDFFIYFSALAFILLLIVLIFKFSRNKLESFCGVDDDCIPGNICVNRICVPSK